MSDANDRNATLEVSEEFSADRPQNRAKRGGKEGQFPEKLFVFPLVKRPFFPGMAVPLLIEPGPYYEVLKIIAKSRYKMLGLFLTRKEEVDIYAIGFKDLFEVGVLATILRIIPLEQGGAQVVFSMERRIKLGKPVAKSKYLRAEVSYHRDLISQRRSKEVQAYSTSILVTIKELLKLNPLFKEELQLFLGHSDFTEPGKLADFSVALTTAGRGDLQGILEAFDVQTRIDKTLVLLRREVDINKLQSSINRKIEATISKSQREFLLRQQLQMIKRELGLEKDEKTCDVEKFRARLRGKEVPEEARKAIEEELDKFSVLEAHSAEYSVSRNYLDWLTLIPWGVKSREDCDLARAERVLEREHYGLRDVKEQILECISVGKLAGGMKGSIICFVGPPGVGKTSVGRSIANALHRKFFVFSVGGMRDEAEIKGHRRTYVGAMPGKIVRGLKETGVMNPVIMIDEVDKLEKSYQGDPASALLEVLDPGENMRFLDYYLDVRCDLSDVLFILTANVLDTIPAPLLDRMDVLRLSGYIKEEKVEIAKRYLIPRNRKVSGLSGKELRFTQRAVGEMVEKYAREAGVRGLEKMIKKVLRKVAKGVVQARERRQNRYEKKKGDRVEVASESKTREKSTVISTKNLERYLGKPVFAMNRYYDRTPIGVCTGLAWTERGGVPLYVEAVQAPSEKTGIKLTGQAGEVMKESAQIVWTFVKSHIDQFSSSPRFFDKSEVHLHIPEGATPKEGPSAGITMVTALLSLLKDEPVLQGLGMTGELTLTGKVLPIGGVKEKLIAARGVGLKALIFPKGNRRDCEELPDYLKTGLHIYFVDTYSDVFRIAFPGQRQLELGVRRDEG